MSLELDLNNIKPLVSNDLKTMMDEFDRMILKVSKRYNINFVDVKDFLKEDLNKFSIKLGVKKRNRRVLPAEKQCMGRKLDGKQCTRGRYREDSEFCKVMRVINCLSEG